MTKGQVIETRITPSTLSTTGDDCVITATSGGAKVGQAKMTVASVVVPTVIQPGSISL